MSMNQRLILASWYSDLASSTTSWLWTNTLVLDASTSAYCLFVAVPLLYGLANRLINPSVDTNNNLYDQYTREPQLQQHDNKTPVLLAKEQWVLKKKLDSSQASETSKYYWVPSAHPCRSLLFIVSKCSWDLWFSNRQSEQHYGQAVAAAATAAAAEQNSVRHGIYLDPWDTDTCSPLQSVHRPTHLG